MAEDLTASLDEMVEARREMLFSADCLDAVTTFKWRLGRMLADKALDIARHDGRKLVTSDDAFAALDALGLSAIDPPRPDYCLQPQIDRCQSKGRESGGSEP